MSAATLRHRGSLACLLAVALTATACSSSSGVAAPPNASGTSGTATPATTSATSAAPTSAGAPTTSTGTSAPAPTGGPPASASATTNTPAPATTTTIKATGGGDFCRTIASAVNNPITPSGTGGTSLKAEKALIEKGLAQGRAALGKAPGEIRPDAAIVLTALDNLSKALVKADYDYTKIEPRALAAVSSATVTTAEAHLAAYVQKSCGFSIGTG
jgi:hypothetical protein